MIDDIDLDEPAPIINQRGCHLCPFTVPHTTKHPANALRSHIRNAHEGWAEEKRVKPQFLALVEATGSYELALHFADDVITWNRPADRVLRDWAVDAEEQEDDGRPAVTQKQVDRMARRLRQVEEWKGRKALDLNRRASMRVSQEIIDTGTTAKPVLSQYLGMNNAYQTKELAIAYPHQRQQARKGGVSVKSVQRQPEQKALPPPATVNAEFRVIESEEKVG